MSTKLRTKVKDPNCNTIMESKDLAAHGKQNKI